MINSEVAKVAKRIIDRSANARGENLERMGKVYDHCVAAARPGCSNFTHAKAGMPTDGKATMSRNDVPNIVIVTAYRDIARPLADADLSDNEYGIGQELLQPFHGVVGSPAEGASVFFEETTA